MGSIHKHTFLSKLIILAPLLVFIVLDCNKSTPVEINGGQAVMQFVDMDGNSIPSGQVTTDAGTFTIANGRTSVEWTGSDAATVVIPGFVQRGTFVEDKIFIMIPNSWNEFFSNGNIAGYYEGTRKFNIETDMIRYFIDGPTEDTDYNVAKFRLERILNQCGFPYKQVMTVGECNYKIWLNYSNYLGGATINDKGIITFVNVYLRDGVEPERSDHELAKVLINGDEVLGCPEPSIIASSSEPGGFQPGDLKIIKAVYNRLHSKIQMGSEQENR